MLKKDHFSFVYLYCILWFMSRCIHTYVYIDIHVHICIYVYIYIYIYIYTYIVFSCHYLSISILYASVYRHRYINVLHSLVHMYSFYLD